MFLDLIFPKTCVSCKRSGLYICNNCLKILSIPKSVCPVCEKHSIDGFTHIKCQSKHSLDGITSIWPYAGVIRKAIITMKYRFAYKIASEIANSATVILKETYPIKTFQQVTLTPIPIHRKRENWRGFNQSEIIGRRICRLLGWKFISDFLIRKKVVVPQTGLKGKERIENIRGAFGLNPQYSKFNIPHSAILFDDVWTTGSTLKEAGKVLKRNGFTKVWGLTIAR